MRNKTALRLVTFFLLLMVANVCEAEIRAPQDGGFTKSLGLPPKRNWHLGISGGGQFKADSYMTAYGRFGYFQSLLHPITGIGGITLEGYGGVRAEEWDYGARAMLSVPILRFGLGADYNIPDGDGDFLLALSFLLRRGGVFGHGTDIRFEWLPGRGNAFNVALNVPLWQPNAGKTRPQQPYVRIKGPAPKSVVYENTDEHLEGALDNLSDLSLWICRLTTPFIDQNAWSREGALKKFESDMREIDTFLKSRSPLFPEGATSDLVVRRFHEELDRAFSIAISGQPLEVGESTASGRMIAKKAKEVILEEIILPYNSSLGQFRKENTTEPLAMNARGRIVTWIITEIDNMASESDRWRAAGYAFVRLLNMIEANHKYMSDRWEDSRLVWLPLQYALLPEQHDSQEEIDRLIELSTGEKLTTGNRHWYLINEQFQYEFYRQVQTAEDYHVLWIHDYSGKNDHGDPDLVGFEQTKGYIKALIKHVRAYDRTAKIPVYIIIIDQFFWEPHDGRIWSELLQDPLEHRLDLGDGFEYMEKEMAELQDELQLAVDQSRLLQAQARQYGDDWLKNLIKVHVNITNPADFTFRVRDTLPFVGLPDDVMRDHRKISFYDITEKDPYKGMAIYTGMGVGEHYSGATWEDRAVLAQGPALLSLKYAARELFIDQGFEEEEIPYPLQVFEKPDNYDDLVMKNTRFADGQAVKDAQMHNQTGYGPKKGDVLKAVLYTMMPSGSLLKSPDSLWNNPVWASMLVGSALRGARVLIIAPSLAGAPSPGFPQMSRTQELLERLMIIREIFGEEIEDAGGMLRVGLYDPEVGVGDIVARNKAFRRALEDYPFLREVYPFHPDAIDAMEEIVADLEETGFKEQYLTEDTGLQTPKLHLKAQLFASREAWDEMIASPEWVYAIRLVAGYRLRSLSGEESFPDLSKTTGELAEAGQRIIADLYERLSYLERRKIVYYFTVGSQNMNYRSMLMDGESTYLISYFGALHGVLDFANLAGLCKWPENRDELDKILKPYSGMQRKIGRFARKGA